MAGVWGSIAFGLGKGLLDLWHHYVVFAEVTGLDVSMINLGTVIHAFDYEKLPVGLVIGGITGLALRLVVESATRVAPRFALALAIALGVVLITNVDNEDGSIFAVVFGFVGGLLGGMTALLLNGRAGADRPRRIGRPSRSRRRWRQALNGGLLIAFGSGIALLFYEWPSVIYNWPENAYLIILYPVTGGLSFGLIGTMVFGLALGLDATERTPLLLPRAQQRDDLVYWLVVGVAVGFLMGFLLGGTEGAMTIASVIASASAMAWRVPAGQLYLSIRYRTPLRLSRFLDDAHKRNILRTVGSTYQFRHAALQDRLAPPQPADSTDPTTARLLSSPPTRPGS